MATVNFTCPSCGRQVACNERVGGRKIRCPGCQSIQQVPEEPQEGQSTIAPPVAPSLPPQRPGVVAKPGVKPRARASTIRVSSGGAGGGSAGGMARHLPIILGGMAGAIVFLAAFWFFASGDDEVADTDAQEPRDSLVEAADSGVAMEPVMAAAMERLSLTADDLAFVPANAEALVVYRFGSELDATTGQAAEGFPDAVRSLLADLRRAAPVNADEVDCVAAAFADLELGSWFGYFDRIRLYERRIARARSATLRNRLRAELQRHPKPEPPRFLARIQMREAVDPAVLLAEVDEVESVESPGGEYLRFQMPGIFGGGDRASLGAVDMGSGVIVLGHETLVRESLRSVGGRSLGELGLNAKDLDGDAIVSFFPTPASRNSIKSWLIRRFAARDEQGDFGELDRLASAYARLDWSSGRDAFDIRVGVGSRESAAVDDNRRAVENWLARATPALDELRGSLPSALADSLSQILVGAVPMEDGLRVDLPFEMSSRALAQAGTLLTQRLERTNSAPATVESTSPTAVRLRREPRERPSGPAPARRNLDSARRQDLSEGRIVSGAPLSTVPTRTLRGWTMNILNATIPDRPLEGMVAGRSFKPDEALVESGVLTLRMAVGQSSETVVEVHGIQRIGESLEGKAFELPAVSGMNTPSVFFRWNDPTRIDTAVRRFYNRFALKLEFGSLQKGRIDGRIFIAVHDVDKSFINGTFEADIR